MSSFPVCKVCQRQFSLKGPAPFLLPCLHSVCETCITSAAGGVISCDPCQRDVNLTETCPQKDVITEKEVLHLTVQHKPELVLCTHEDDGNQAKCWCKECEDFLCEDCQNVHRSFKGYNQHTVFDVGDLELGTLNEDRYCTVHPKFISDTWDTNCCVLTCGKCRLGDHSGHDAVEVEKAVQNSLRAVASFKEEVNNFADKHIAHSTEAKEDLQNSAKSNRILPEKISTTFNSLKTLIDQREEELRNAHQQQHDALEKNLNDKKNSSDLGHQRCKATSDYISKTLKYSSMNDLLELRPLLQEKANDCRSSAPSEDYKSPPLPVFNTVGLAKIRNTLGKFGVITTDTADPDNQSEEWETQIEGTLQKEIEELKEVQTETQTEGTLLQEIEELKEKLEKETFGKKEGKKGFAGFIHSMWNSFKGLSMCIGMVVSVFIVLTSFTILREEDIWLNLSELFVYLELLFNEFRLVHI